MNYSMEAIDKANSHNPADVLIAMMAVNIKHAKSILNLADKWGLKDSVEFIEWQDKLNAISVYY